MGACDSTNTSNSKEKFRRPTPQILSNTKESTKDVLIKKNETKQIEATVKLYPRGSAILLRNNENNLRRNNLSKQIEINVCLSRIPLQGKYEVKMKILEEKCSPIHLPSLIQEADINSQVNYLKSLTIDYFFERLQYLEIEVELELSGLTVNFKEFIGKLASSIKDPVILEDKDKGLVCELKMNPVKKTKKQYSIEIILNKDKSKSVLDKELYYIIQNNFSDDKNTYRSIYKSEEDTNGQFNSITLSEDHLFLDQNQKIMFTLYNSSESVIVGTGMASINDLKINHIISIISPSTNLPVAEFIVMLDEFEEVGFVDLLKNGLQVSLMVAIDFTVSNGIHTSLSSLHYIGSHHYNQYEKAMIAISGIISNYDTDQSIPLVGFGGIPKGKLNVEHVFPLNGLDNPCVKGINEMLSVYRQSVVDNEQGGPSHFSPLLKNLSNLVISHNINPTYFVITIITDGQINDVEETIDAIVECSFLPISIIIIGVGDASFEEMGKLVGNGRYNLSKNNNLQLDDMPLKNSRGISVARDIIQFLPFKEYENNTDKLVGELLKNLPEQIEIYNRSKPLTTIA